MLHDFFEYIVNKHGVPKKVVPLTEKDLLELEHILPDHLVEFYRTFGSCSLRGGLLQICRPKDLQGIIKLIFDSDPDLNHEKSHAFAYTPFGDIYYFNEQYGCGSIELLNGNVFNYNLTIPSEISTSIDNTVFMPFSLSDESLDFTDDKGKRLFSRAKKLYGELDSLECYGFVPALALADEPDIKSIRRLKAPEYFGIIAQLQNFELIEILDMGRTKAVRQIGNSASQ